MAFDGRVNEKKTVALLKTAIFISQKKYIDSRVFSPAPGYYLHPWWVLR